MIAKLLIPFVVLIFASVPIAFSQGLAYLFLMSVEDVISGESFVKGITAGLNSFTLAAVTLFTFAGDIMGKGGISRRLLDLGRIVFDRFTGGLGMVAIVACMFFAAISAALPYPTIPGTFSVPARRLRSCAPPCTKERIFTPLRM